MPKKTPEQYAALTFTSSQPRIMAFQNLVEPKAPPLRAGVAKPQYSATFLLNGETDPLFTTNLTGSDGKPPKSIARLALTVVREEFPELFAAAVKAHQAASGVNAVLGIIERLKLAGVKFPFLTGEEVNSARRAEGKPEYEWAFGKILFKTSSGADKQPNLGSVETAKGIKYDGAQIAINSGKFYSGAEAYFEVLFAGYLVDGKRYVKAYLQKVYVTGKGTPLGKGGAETFDQYTGHVSAVNPVDDDTIPF